MKQKASILLLQLFILTVLGSYNKQHRDAAIEADLNKLYDTKPSPGSPTNDVYSKEQKSRLSDGNNNVESGESVFTDPYFDLDHSVNVTAVLGKTALLNCRVKNIGNKTVSWLRDIDTHLLTIGRLTYTSDLRFKAIHKLYSEDYLLQIKPTTHRDSGKYACQISTTPPNSHIVTLTIAEPKTARTLIAIKKENQYIQRLTLRSK